MSRIYTCTTQITTGTAALDLFECLPADDKPIKLRGFAISQITEIGDAQEEDLDLLVKRLPATVTSGSGGSAITPAPMDSADSAAGCSVEMGNTTRASTTGTAVSLARYGWNERSTPYEVWYPDAAFSPKVKQGEGLVIGVENTPADAITLNVTVFLEEE